MTEKNKEKIKKEIQRLQDELNLLHWRIEIVWAEYEHLEGALAEVHPNAPYNDVVISFYPAFEKEMTKSWDKAKTVLRHEMCHVVLAPFVHVANQRFVDKGTFMDAHEVVTSQIEKIITRICDRRNQNQTRH